MTEPEDEKPPVGDDYLWDGQGDPPPEIARLESLAGEARLEAPLSSASRRRWPVAVVAGCLAAIAVAAAAPPRLLPPGLVAALLPGVSGPLEVEGGSAVDVSITAPAGHATWRADLDRRLAEAGGRASGGGTRLTLELPRMDPAAATAWVEQAFGPTRFEVFSVVDRSEYMKAVYARVQGDARAAALGVTGEIDAWGDNDGRPHGDWYLRADRRESLVAYLAELTGPGDGSLPTEAGRALLLERTTDGGWRTYYVTSRAELGPADLAAASASTNPFDARADVQLELTDDGARRFADLTGRVAGHKVAIALGGVVHSAPVVMERIDGGRLTVRVGGDTPEENERAASALAARLQPTASPLEVDVVDARAAGAVLSSAERQRARGLLGLVAGLLVAGAFLLAARLPRPIDPEVTPRRGRPADRRPAIRKLVVTLLGVGLAALVPFVPVPGLHELREVIGSGPRTGLGALGIGSVITAFVLVELIALIVPRWRRLRRGGPGDRQRLATASGLLAVALLAVQAYLVVIWLASLGRETPTFGVPVPIVVETSADVVRLIGLYLTGSTVLLAIALAVERWGLANGFTSVLVGLEIAELAHAIRSEPIANTWQERAALLEGRLVALAAVVVVAGLTALVLGWRARRRRPTSFRLPTAGVIPASAAVSIGGALAVLALWPGAHVEGLQRAWERLWTHPVGAMALVLAVSLALSWLFSRPSRVAGLATVVDPAFRRRVWATFAGATLLSTGYVLALFGIQLALGRWSPVALVSAVTVAMATALVMDGLAEWRAFRRRDDLVPIWPLHHVQRADGVIDALAREGIDVHARSLRLRSLLHFFGPYVPIVLFVPADRREDALAILRAQAGSSPPPEPLSDDEMRGASQAR